MAVNVTISSNGNCAPQVLRICAIELGVNFVDTADSYGPETNEMQIAQALYPYPSGLVIATRWIPGLRPRGIPE